MHKDTKQLLSDAKFFEGYSRFNDAQNRYETWDESVDRVMTMHKKFYDKKITPELDNIINEATKAYKEKRILGAQRALQFGGDQLLKHHLKLYNCTGSYADRAEFFGEFFYTLLCGCGAGFSVQNHHIAKIPAIALRSKQPKTHVVEDSIEGWAESLDVLMSSYFVGGGKHPEYEGRKVYFDLTNIRQKGAKISGGFKAPGPEPLRFALDKIEYLLQGVALKKDGKLRAIQVYDICMFTADAVLAGGVRRSATICLFSPEDEEMAMAKTGNWYNDNPQRARSNNSAMIVRKNITRELFKKLMTSIRQFGEPGFVFTESTEHATNPCLSGETMITTDEGVYSIYDLVSKYKDKEDKTINILVDGKFEKTTSKGFWKTGVKLTFDVRLKNGMSIKATNNHQFLTENGWKELKDLVPGDFIKITDNKDISWKGEGTKEEGWLLGNLIGDGTFASDDEVKWEYWGDDSLNEINSCVKYLSDMHDTYKRDEVEFISGKKKSIFSQRFVPIARKWNVIRGQKYFNKYIEQGNPEFYSGVIGGFFDADGTVYGNKDSGLTVAFSQAHKSSLEIVQRMLSRLGILSKLRMTKPEGMYLLPDGKGGEAYYPTKDVYELRITGRYDLERFAEIILINNQSKSAYLKQSLSEYTKVVYNTRKTFIEITEISKYYNMEVFDCTVPATSAFEANGIHVHNCVEIGFYPQLDGVSGWQGCNLSEINGGMCIDEESFYLACRTAAIMGTLQAGYTDFKYLSEVSRKIFEREALIGVSITGWMNNPNILFDAKILRKGAEIVKKTNREVALLLGINPAARTTCVKPSGNASVLLMTASGIHPEHAPRYLRNAQMNKDSEVAKLIKETNPLMVEESVWSASKSDYSIAFPFISPKGSLYKNELMGVDHLEKVKLAQKNWVEAGTDESLCVDPTVRHNVSNTIIVDDWDAVEEYVFKNRDSFAGISFLSMSGDKDYPQAPFTKVIDAKEIIKIYGTGGVFASGLVVEGLKAFNNDLWVALSTAQGMGEDINQDNNENLLKKDWVRRFKKFTLNYFAGDIKQSEFCLKDVYLLHKWEKIQQNLVDIDWLSALTEKKFIDVDTLASAACIGSVEGCFI